jgi:hypothetical protein
MDVREGSARPAEESLVQELRSSALLFGMALLSTAGAVGVTHLAVSVLS